ncbi:MAG: VOC family protein [SAR202 cluster bacterium]|nr:VOC family protein [SAR202 cluster bacterium]
MDLNHTIVPAHDKDASAQFIARILGLRYEGPVGHFAAVRVNDALTLDFDDWDEFTTHHYAFKVTDAEFDAAFERIRQEGVAYGSSPFAQDDMRINRRQGGRGLYFRDANGHSWELLTRG